MHNFGDVSATILAILVAQFFNWRGTRELKAELKKEIGELRTELKGEISGLRAEVKDDMREVRHRMDTIDGHLISFFSITGRLDGKVEMLEKRAS